MKKVISLNVITILIAAIVFVAVYYLLLQDNCDASISSIMNKSTHLDVKRHILVLGLVPIYIATVIFGAALLSIYAGSIIQKSLSKCWRDAKTKRPAQCNLTIENNHITREI